MVAVLTVLLGLFAASLMARFAPGSVVAAEAEIPERFVDTSVGRVPDVSGMDLFHAARLLASHHFYPVLENALDHDSTLKVNRLVGYREIDDTLPESTVIESARYGWMAFNRDGDWVGAVVLSLSR